MRFRNVVKMIAAAIAVGAAPAVVHAAQGTTITAVDFQAFSAQRDQLVQHAAMTFDREMEREKAGDCPNVVTTYDENVCLGQEVATTTANYKDYADTLRSLMGLRDSSAIVADGPTGTPPTPDEMAKEFDRIETAWDAYRTVLCSAAYHQYRGGTIAPSIELSCNLRAMRTHIRELGGILGNLFLH
jgi:uncharacterized protein YecT (DUF1311 family)